MNKIYAKRISAFISILVLMLVFASNVFAMGLPGIVGDTNDRRNANDADDGMFDGDITPFDADGDGTTDLPDGDKDNGTTAAPSTTAAPTTTRAPSTTASPATTSPLTEDNDAKTMSGVWIVILLVLLAAVIVIIIAAMTKKK